MTDNSQTISLAQVQEEYWNCVCIPLTRGQHTIIDAEDYEQALNSKWHAVPGNCGNFYASTSRRLNNKWVNCRVHRLLMDAKPGELIDHINRKTLDNRKSNLRLANVFQNSHNSSPVKGSSSQYKGVHKRGNVWRAQICRNRKTIVLGNFSNEIEAAKAYDNEAAKYYGKYAYLNFFPPTP